jgi:hypothetical protein
LASALRDFLPDAFQDIETWMSEHDIAAGTRWGHELTGQLSESLVGIICLTAENLSAPWLLFESGALAKSIADSRVIPYRLGLSATDVTFPLALFQGVDADEAGTRKLLSSLNAVREKPMPEDRLDRNFARWWPDLNARIQGIMKTNKMVTAPRADRAMLEEILELVRSRLAPPPSTTVGFPENYMPKDTVWKTIHSVTVDEMQSMDAATLKQFVAAMRNRWNSVSGGEEAALDRRIETAEKILAEKSVLQATAELQ